MKKKRIFILIIFLVIVSAVVAVVVIKKKKAAKAEAEKQTPKNSNSNSGNSAGGGGSKSEKTTFPMQKGSKGDKVVQLQEALNQYKNAGLSVDGIWGDKTQAALEACKYTKNGNKITSIATESIFNEVMALINGTAKAYEQQGSSKQKEEDKNQGWWDRLWNTY